MRSLQVAFLCAALILGSQSSLSAGIITFSWSGSRIAGEDPDFLPDGSATFEVIGGKLLITLTNDTAQELNTIGQVLSGLTWDITNSGVTLGKLDAVIASGGKLVGTGATSDTNLSSEWAFKDDISAGSSVSGPLGSFGIGAIGDINFAADTFGPGDRFDTSTNLFGPSSGSLNGIDAAIVGAFVDFDLGGFPAHGPVVQGFDGSDTAPGQMVFRFDITAGSFTVDEIKNVQPLFGSDGTTLTPEPSSLTIFGGFAIAMLFYCWRQRKKAAPVEVSTTGLR